MAQEKPKETVAVVEEKKNKSDERDLDLEGTWSVWYDNKKNRQNNKSKKEEWKNHLRKVGDFSTVLTFWRFYAWMKKPSELEAGMNIYIARQGKDPMWESFPDGGCWIIRFHKQNAKNGVIDGVWEELVLAVVGEQFRTPELVAINLSCRTNKIHGREVSHIISVWNRDTRKPSAKFRIGERLKVLLHLAADSTIEYKLFSRAIQDGSTYRGAQQYTYVPT